MERIWHNFCNVWQKIFHLESLNIIFNGYQSILNICYDISDFLHSNLTFWPNHCIFWLARPEYRPCIAPQILMVIVLGFDQGYWSPAAVVINRHLENSSHDMSRYIDPLGMLLSLRACEQKYGSLLHFTYLPSLRPFLQHFWNFESGCVFPPEAKQLIFDLICQKFQKLLGKLVKKRMNLSGRGSIYFDRTL